ncbi:MAG: hypothetical protein ACR2JQ_07295 [Mycobacteriales bacterium]
MSVQLSFFTGDAQPPGIDALEGLLAGPGQLVRRDRSARLSLVLADGWRADAVQVAFEARGLAPERRDAAGERSSARLVTVRTAFDDRLAVLAARWTRGAMKRPPTDLVLDGPRIRLWTVAAGEPTPGGYLLRLAGVDADGWGTCGGALAAAGLTGTLVGPRAGGPAVRITGRRRLSRLRESAGEPPPGGAAQWPAAG